MAGTIRCASRGGDRQPRRLRRVVGALGWLGALAALCLVPAVRTARAGADGAPLELGDVIRGWRVFHEKRCVHCHAVWGQGGAIGPDLGRASTGYLDANALAGQMWNHVPRMLALLRQYRLSEVALTRTEMADMFAFLYFARYLDQPGDPREGSRILVQKRCAECHALEHEGGQIGPDLTRWAGRVNPIDWAQLMWEHGAGMAAAMKARGIEWPELGEDDLANIIAFVRSVGPTSEKRYLRPGSAAAGQRLFLERKCATCHSPAGQVQPQGPDLARIELPRSLSGLASRMWNHQPVMRKLMAEQNVQAAPLTAQEMADIIAFVFAQQYALERGDPQRGKLVFERKRCVECHRFAPPAATATGPASRASAVDMARAVWEHGAVMVDRMAAAGIAWPIFEGTEMADLVAYIESLGSLTVVAPDAPPSGSGGADKHKPQ